VSDMPLGHALGFWKPLLDPSELRDLAVRRELGQPLVRGLNVMRVGTAPRSFRIADGDATIAIFAAVHPIDEVPPAAEVVADVLDPSGAHYSYVLRFPDRGAVLVPFDPDEAVGSFWHEDYIPPSKRTALPKPLLSLYYSVAKPLMPAPLKRRLRRAMAHRALASESALQWPTDESLDRLQRFLLRLIMIAIGRDELPFVWFWPDRHPWAVALTHDVETARGLANVSHVAGLERPRGLRSSFNLVPRDYEVPASVLEELNDGGYEVGVHGYTHDGLLFSSRAVFLERVAAINEYGRKVGAAGFRSPATYRNLDWFDRFEFEYDSSVSNTAPCEPQPGGCGSFFPYFVGDLVEMPITLPQDHTLFELLEQTDASTWLECLERIRGAHGMACVLAHPDPAAGYIGMSENEAHYVELLDVVAGSDAWTPLPRDLVRWWRLRAHTETVDAADSERMSFGTAVLDASGRLEIVPPIA
jgi:hypothetical protein